MQCESRSVSRILFFDANAEAAIIHLAQPSPVGSSDLPGGRSVLFTARIGRAALVDASLFGLALRGVCLAAGVTTVRRCALTSTVSPITRNHECFRRSARDPLAGLFSVALVVIRQAESGT